MSTRITEPQLSLKSNKIQNLQLIPSSFTPATIINGWLPYQILGGKTVTNVQIDPQTIEIVEVKLISQHLPQPQQPSVVLSNSCKIYVQPKQPLAEETANENTELKREIMILKHFKSCRQYRVLWCNTMSMRSPIQQFFTLSQTLLVSLN